MRDRFIRLLKPVYPALEEHCRALCMGDDRIEARDVLQESLVNAFLKFDQLKDPGAFKGWLFTIAIRCYRSERRKSFLKRTVRLGLIDQKQLGIIQANEPSELESSNLVTTAIARLKPSDRMILVLFHVSGFSVQEISEMSRDRSISATKSRLARARARMREIIRELDGDYSQKLSVSPEPERA